MIELIDDEIEKIKIICKENQKISYTHEGSKIIKTDKDKKAPVKKIKVREPDYRLGPLTSEGLQSDNQVLHALEILLSYEIFKSKLNP